MDPDDVPASVTKLVYTDPDNPSVSQNAIAVTLAHYWPAIERHIREEVASELASLGIVDLSSHRTGYAEGWNDALRGACNRIRS
jgi:hypothetical protein